MTWTSAELSQLLADIRRPHAANRDSLWDARANVRHRRLVPTLPEGLTQGIKALDGLDYRSVQPEYVITQIKARLGANEIHIATKMRGLQQRRERLGEKIEDWLRGCLAELDPNGNTDAQVRDAQTAVGIAWTELEFRPEYVPPPRAEYMSDSSYDEAVTDGRQRYGLPFYLSFISPRAIYWGPIDRPEQPKIVAKVVTLPLYDVENAYSSEGFKIAYREESAGRGRFVKAPILGGGMAPGQLTTQFNRLVRIVVIADDRNIYHCMFPQVHNTAQAGLGVGEFADDTAAAMGGSTPTLELLAAYPNPLGRPPFFAAIGRQTDDPDPAYRFKPLAAEVLDLSVMVNNYRTMRAVRAWLDMYKPLHMQPRVPAAPGTQLKQETPMVWRPDAPVVFDGEFREIPSPQSRDLDVQEQQIMEELRSYNQSLAAAIQTGSIGRSTPAWSIMQMNEETRGLLDEAQNSRAAMYRDILMAILRCSARKYAKSAPLYVSSPRAAKDNPARKYEDLLDVSGEELRDFLGAGRVEVTISSETMSMRAAATEYYRSLMTEGTISQETYEDSIGIPDRVAEQARKDKEKVERPLKLAAQTLAYLYAKQTLIATHGPIMEAIFANIPDPFNGQQAAAPAPPMGGEQTPMLDRLRMPGQGMQTTVPQPSVLAAPSPGGMIG